MFGMFLWKLIANLSCGFRLASLEAGGRDNREFLKWQEEMKHKDAAEELAELERRHLVRM